MGKNNFSVPGRKINYYTLYLVIALEKILSYHKILYLTDFSVLFRKLLIFQRKKYVIYIILLGVVSPHVFCGIFRQNRESSCP